MKCIRIFPCVWSACGVSDLLQKGHDLYVYQFTQQQPPKKVQVCTVKDTHKTNTPTQQTVRKQRSLAHSSISIVTFGCVNNARQSLARLLNYSAGERIARYKVPAQDTGTRSARRPHTNTDRHGKTCRANRTTRRLYAVPLLWSDSVFVVGGSDKSFVIRWPLLLSVDVSIKL